MKKLLSVILFSIFLITACQKTCEHDWVNSTCLTPKTCKNCNLTEGTSLNHLYDDWSKLYSLSDLVTSCVKLGVNDTHVNELECQEHETLLFSCYQYYSIFSVRKEAIIFAKIEYLLNK